MSDKQKSKSELVSEVTKLQRKISTLQAQIKKNKSKEQELEHQNDLLRIVIDSVPDLIWVKDTKSRKLLSNPIDISRLGARTEKDVLGKNDYDFYPKEVADGFYANDQFVIKNGTPVINREDSYLDSAGQRRWILTTKLPIFDDNGVVTQIVGIGRDITQQKVIEMELQESKTQLNSKSF